jgi:transcriptional regulator with XRE-family HTH domain
LGTGEKLRALRLRRNMTQAQLAAASRLSKGFLSQIEHGLANPSLDSLRRIASSLGVALSELVEDSHDMQAACRHGGQAEGPLQAVRARAPEAEVGIRELAVTPESAFVRVGLPPGGRLEGGAGTAGRAPSEGQAMAIAVCLPVKGSVSLQQQGQTVMLFAGDVATWDAMKPYTLENRAQSAALVFLSIPRAAGLPVMAVGGKQASPAKMQAGMEHLQGPFRLVAMRAARRQMRGD